MDKTVNNTNKSIKVMDKLVSVLTTDDLASICEEEGLTVRGLVKCLSDGMKSMTEPKLNNTGQVIESSVVPDRYARHKYMSSGMELLKLIGNKQLEIKTTVTHHMSEEDIINIKKIVENGERLRKEWLTNPMQHGRQYVDVTPV